MKLLNLWNKIGFYGLWTQPIVMSLFVRVWLWNKPRSDITVDELFVFMLVSLIPSLYIYSKNSIARQNGKVKFGLFDAIGNTTDAYYMSSNKSKAMRPEVDNRLLHKKPTGITLGKYKGKYVCYDLNNSNAHMMLIGGSGSGKSSCYALNMILSNPRLSIFAVDIKGELHQKGVKCTDDNVIVFNPQDRIAYGYNPFYRLNEDSSNQEILEVMQTIAYSLIALPADIKDPFWKTSARNLLIGLLVHYYKGEQKDFVSIVDKILSKPIKESIKEVLESAKSNSIEYRYIVGFSDIADETLSGIAVECVNHINIFVNDADIRYAFRDNRLKLSPLKLEEGYSVYLAIREEKLSAYHEVLQLIINQTLEELEKRPEDSKPIVVLLDELPRILSEGKLHKLLDAARTLRSRRVILFLITQSIEALMIAYSENEVTDLITNCPYIVVLGASSTKTQKMVCDWCGQYKEKKHSISGSGTSRKRTIAYEDMDIVEPADLMGLVLTGEAIVITPYGYCRIRKVPYYMDKFFKPLAEEVINKNSFFIGGKNNDK